MQTWKLICSHLASGDDDQDEIYVRGCGLAFNYDDEEDSCVRYGKWNEEHRECVCNEDECNGAGVSKASVAMLAVASVSVRSFVQGLSTCQVRCPSFQVSAALFD